MNVYFFNLEDWLESAEIHRKKSLFWTDTI